jgi:hypothetical protein
LKLLSSPCSRSDILPRNLYLKTIIQAILMQRFWGFHDLRGWKNGFLSKSSRVYLLFWVCVCYHHGGCWSGEVGAGENEMKEENNILWGLILAKYVLFNPHKNLQVSIDSLWQTGKAEVQGGQVNLLKWHRCHLAWYLNPELFGSSHNAPPYPTLYSKHHQCQLHTIGAIHPWFHSGT